MPRDESEELSVRREARPVSRRWADTLRWAYCRTSLWINRHRPDDISLLVLRLTSVGDAIARARDRKRSVEVTRYQGAAFRRQVVSHDAVMVVVQDNPSVRHQNRFVDGTGNRRNLPELRRWRLTQGVSRWGTGRGRGSGDAWDCGIARRCAEGDREITVVRVMFRLSY